MRIEVCELTPPDTESNCGVLAADKGIVAWAAAADTFSIYTTGGSMASYMDNFQIYGTSENL